MKVCIVGITGRMGGILSSLLGVNELVGGISSRTSDAELCDLIKNSDVLIDFSSPASTLRAVEKASFFRVPMIIGTTGLSGSDFNIIKKNSQYTPILYASNFSICIHLMASLIKKCSQLLCDFDVNIVDIHHNKKKDAPSGTASFLANQLNETPQISSIRAGGIFGEHTCSFTGEHEIISIQHRAFDRKVFALGAIACSKWIIGKKPDLYTMKDFMDDSANR